MNDDRLFREIVNRATKLGAARFGVLSLQGRAGCPLAIYTSGFDEVLENILGPLIDTIPREGGIVHADAQQAWLGEFRDCMAAVEPFLDLPITGNGRSLGHLYLVGKPSGDQFSSSDREMLRAYLLGASLALENPTSIRKNVKRPRELEAVHAVAAELNRFSDVKSVFQRALEVAVSEFGLAGANLYLWDEEAERLCPLAWAGYTHNAIAKMPLKSGQGIPGRVFAKGEPLFFGDLETDSLYPRFSMTKFALQAGFRTGAWIPIEMYNRPVGVIGAYRKEARQFSPEEIELMVAIATLVAIAWAKERASRETTEKSKQLETLVRINSDIASLLERQTLLPRIVEEARQLLQVDAVSLRLFEGRQSIQAAYAGSEVIPNNPRDRPVTGTISGKLIEECRIIAIHDLHAGPLPRDVDVSELLARGCKAALALPVRVGSKVIGTLFCLSATKRRFKEQEIELIKGFAAQAAIAVENADLFAKVEANASALETLNRDLQEANNAKSQFVAGMSHELRTPIQVIMGYSNLLLEGFAEGTSERDQALKTITYQSRMLLKLIDDVLTFTRMERGRLAPRESSFSLKDTLKHVCKYVEHLNRDRRVNVFWQTDTDLPIMRTDPVWLEEILQNLISNAYKFTPDGGQIEIGIRRALSCGFIEFRVSDMGIGIDESKHEQIFDAFYQSSRAHTGEYGGVGLPLDQSTVE